MRNTLQRDNDVSTILDPILNTSHHDKEVVWKMTEIAMMCVEPKSIHRPTMIEVVNELRGTLAMEEAKSSKTSHHHRQHSRGSSSLEFNSTGLSLSDPHWPTPRWYVGLKMVTKVQHKFSKCYFSYQMLLIKHRFSNMYYLLLNTSLAYMFGKKFGIAIGAFCFYYRNINFLSFV